MPIIHQSYRSTDSEHDSVYDIIGSYAHYACTRMTNYSDYQNDLLNKQRVPPVVRGIMKVSSAQMRTNRVEGGACSYLNEQILLFLLFSEMPHHFQKCVAIVLSIANEPKLEEHNIGEQNSIILTVSRSSRGPYLAVSRIRISLDR